MVKITNLLCTLFALLVVVSMNSCTDTESASDPTAGVATSIPSNASGVLLFNTKQLLSKADYNSLKETEFFKEWIKNAQKDAPEMVPFLEDPEASGISLQSNIGLYFAMEKEKAKAGLPPEAAFLFPVADPAKVAEAVQKALKDSPDAKTEEKDGYSITALDNDLFLVQSPKIFAATTFNDEAKIKNMIAPSGNDINTNSNFANNPHNGKDIMFWMHADPLVESMLAADPMMNLSVKASMGVAQIPEEALKNNYLSVYYDFKDGGEIEAGSVFEFSEPLKQELGPLFPDELTADYAKYLPAENLAIAASLGVNSPGVLNFLAKRGFDQQVDKQLKAVGLDLGQIKEGITGDLAAGVYPPSTEGADPDIVLALGLKDKAFMEGIMEKFGPMLNAQKSGDKYTMTGGSNMMDPSAKPMQFFASIQGDIVVISNSEAKLDQALAGNNNELVAELQKGWLGIYTNYETVGNFSDLLANYIPIDPGSMAVSNLMNEYQDISSVKIIGKGDQLHSHTQLKSTDMNSLKRLIQIADRIFKDREKIQAEIEKHQSDEFEDFDAMFDEENT